MCPKTLVCPLEASAKSDDLLAVTALCLANDLHLKVQLVEIEPPTPIAVEVPISDMLVDEMRELRVKTAERARALEGELLQQGISVEVQGLVGHLYQIGDMAGLHARFSDLTVASASTRASSDLRRRLLYGMLFESGRPMLVEPELDNFTLTLAPRTVVIAWDGGLPASRAVMLATTLLKSADKVDVVCIDPTGDDVVDGQAPGWDLASYLSRHDIKVTITELPSGGARIDEALTRHAMEIGAELIVMGAYGHSRLRERILGGTSKAVLDHCGLPIYMAH